MKKMLRLVNLFLIFFFFPFYVDAAVTATGALNGFIQIVPADVAVHDASTTYSVSADSKSLGSLSWSHTFSETLVMAAGGHIGPSSNPSSSWADKTGSITYDLSGLDFSEFTGIDYIGLEFHSHANLAPSGSGTLVLKDGATVLSTINCTASDQFGPWSFMIPFGDFNASSKIFTVEMNLVNSGQWHSHGVSVDADIPVAERNALIDLYNSTDGANWTNNTNWLGAAGTECTWYGVTCDAGNNYVTDVDLQSNNLVGTIPTSIGNLTNLQILGLNTNQLTGTIPTNLGNLSNLQVLGLYMNELTGNIPTELGNLSSLRELKLAYNQLSGSIPTELGNLTNLTYLDLNGNQLSGSIPTELGNLTNLQYLFLYSNQLTGSIPTELENLSNLQYLWLHDNQLAGSIPPELGNLSSLTYLYLKNNQLTGPVPSELRNLVNLGVGQIDFRWNALYTLDSNLRTFLNNKQVGGDWENTQTIAPTNLVAGAPAQTSVPLTWTAITYIGNTGGYEVYYATTSGGPYTLFETTAGKTVASSTVTGLTTDTTYFFRLRTVTDSHANNGNTVYSEYTGEVSTTTASIPPNADAGPDQTVDEGVTVSLSGSNSSDPDDGIASYQWTQTAGTSVSLSDPTAAQPTFSAPNVGPSGEALTFELTVTDNGGLQSTDTCIVNVTWVNIPPTADAGLDQTLNEGVTVILDGSNSTDSDDGIASYQWTQTAGTSVALSDSTAAQPTFSAPDVGASGDALTFELTVTDNGGLQWTDTCIVNVTWVNVPPMADAGLDQTVNEGVTVTLDGSNSADLDDGIASYRWTQTSGTAVTLSDPTAIQPTFIAPNVGSNGEVLVFELTVADNGGLQSTEPCVVNVSWVNALPVVSDQSISTNENIAVDITLTASDIDGDVLTYSIIDQPSHGTLSGTAPNLTYTPSTGYFGTDSFMFKANDGTADSGIATVTITIDDITSPGTVVLVDMDETTENEPTLDWENVAGSSYYIIQYDNNPDFSNAITIQSINRSDYDIASPIDDGIWYWRMKGVDEAGNESEWSTPGIFIVDTTSYCTFDPEKPVLLFPPYGAENVSRQGTLTSSAFLDPDSCSTHWKSRWQISEREDFHGLTANINTIRKDLTSYQVSKLVLEPNTTYFWRVRYWGSYGNKSKWSDVFSFTTGPAVDDSDDNGIPDDQEVDDYLDLDDDGIFDNDQTDHIKSIKTKKGSNNFGIHPQDSFITRAEAMGDDTVSDDGNKPKYIPYGLVSFRLEVSNSGDTTRVKVYLSEAAPEDSRWVYYDSVYGWQDYSDHAVFNDARNEVTIELKDGGYGDNDHTENGVIVDPSGIGIFIRSTPDNPAMVSPSNEGIFPAGPVTLQTSSFSDSKGNTHMQTHWLIKRADRVYQCSDYDDSFAYVATTVGLTEHTILGLDAGLKYVWKVGYEASGGGSISWSEEYAFKVGTSEVDSNVQVKARTEQLDFKMISFVQWPDDPSATSVFGDEMEGSYDTNYFRIGTYDPMSGSGGYVEYGDNLMIKPGRAYWFMARNGLDITVDGIPVSVHHDIEVELVYNSASRNGWNMIASPNNADYYWDNVEVLEYDNNGNILFGPAPISSLSETNPYIDKRLWRWEDGSYFSDTMWFMKYEGSWVKVKKANVFLRFPVGAQAKLLNFKTRMAHIMSEGTKWIKGWLPTLKKAIADSDGSPPPPIGDFRMTTGQGGSSEKGSDDVGCFITTAAYDLRMEPIQKLVPGTNFNLMD